MLRTRQFSRLKDEKMMDSMPSRITRGLTRVWRQTVFMLAIAVMLSLTIEAQAPAVSSNRLYAAYSARVRKAAGIHTEAGHRDATTGEEAFALGAAFQTPSIPAPT